MGIDFSKFSQEIQSKIKAALEDTKSPDKIDAAELRAMNLEKDVANKLMQELCGNRDYLGDGYIKMQNENKTLILLDKPENNSFIPLTKDSLDYYHKQYYGLDIAQGVYKDGMIYLADSKGKLVKDKFNNYICERVSVQEYEKEEDNISGNFEIIENEPAERTNRRFAVAFIRSMYAEVIGELQTIVSQMGVLDAGMWREALGMGVQAIADLKENQQLITASTKKKIERIEAERDNICNSLNDLIDSPAEFESKFYQLVGKDYRDNAFDELRDIQHNQENKDSKTKFKECVAKFKELYPENNISGNIEDWEDSVEYQKMADEIANIVVMFIMTGGLGKLFNGSVQALAKEILLAAAKGNKKTVIANFAKLAPEVQTVWKSLARGELGVATAQVVTPMAQSAATMSSWEGIKAFLNNLTNAEEMSPEELLKRTLEGIESGAEMGVIMGGLEVVAIAPVMTKMTPVLNKLSGASAEISGLIEKGNGVVSMEKVMATYSKASEVLRGKIIKEGAHTLVALPTLTAGFTITDTAFHFDEAEFRKQLLEAATTDEERRAIMKMNSVDLRLEFAKADFINQVKGMATIEGVGLMFRRLQAGRLAGKTFNQHQRDIIGANLREVKENGKTYYELCTSEGKVLTMKDGNDTITRFSSMEKATAAYSALCLTLYNEIMDLGSGDSLEKKYNGQQTAYEKIGNDIFEVTSKDLTENLTKIEKIKAKIEYLRKTDIQKANELQIVLEMFTNPTSVHDVTDTQIDAVVNYLNSHYDSVKNYLTEQAGEIGISDKNIGRFGHRIKGEWSTRDKIANYIKDSIKKEKECREKGQAYTPRTLLDAYQDVRDKYACRTVFDNVNYANHPEIVKILEEGNYSDAAYRKAQLRAAELQSKPAVDMLKEAMRKAVKEGKDLSMMRISNYTSEGGIPILSEAQLAELKDCGIELGIDVSFIKLASEKDPNTTKMIVDGATTKAQPSGYTALQVNFVTKAGEIMEWQYRGELVNIFAEAEHLPYDLRTGKHPWRQYPELETLYKPIADLLAEKNMPKYAYDQLNHYFTDYYNHLRKLELGFESKEPRLEDYEHWKAKEKDGVEREYTFKFDKRLSAKNLETLHFYGEGIKDGTIKPERALEEYNAEVRESEISTKIVSKSVSAKPVNNEIVDMNDIKELTDFAKKIYNNEILDAEYNAEKIVNSVKYKYQIPMVKALMSFTYKSWYKDEFKHIDSFEILKIMPQLKSMEDVEKVIDLYKTYASKRSWYRTLIESFNSPYFNLLEKIYQTADLDYKTFEILKEEFNTPEKIRQAEKELDTLPLSVKLSGQNIVKALTKNVNGFDYYANEADIKSSVDAKYGEGTFDKYLNGSFTVIQNAKTPEQRRLITELMELRDEPYFIYKNEGKDRFDINYALSNIIDCVKTNEDVDSIVTIFKTRVKEDNGSRQKGVIIDFCDDLEVVFEQMKNHRECFNFIVNKSKADYSSQELIDKLKYLRNIKNPDTLTEMKKYYTEDTLYHIRDFIDMANDPYKFEALKFIIEFNKNQKGDNRTDIFYESPLRFVTDDSSLNYFKMIVNYYQTGSTERLSYLMKIADNEQKREAVKMLLSYQNKDGSKIVNGSTPIEKVTKLVENNADIQKLSDILTKKRLGFFARTLTFKDVVTEMQESPNTKNYIKILKDKYPNIEAQKVLQYVKDDNDFNLALKFLEKDMKWNLSFIPEARKNPDLKKALEYILDNNVSLIDYIGESNLISMKNTYSRVKALHESGIAYIPDKVLSQLNNSRFLTKAYLHDNQMIKETIKIKSFKNGVKLAEMLENVPRGEVCTIDGDLHIREGNKFVKLKMSLKTYLRLFPFREKFDTQQGGVGDCWLISTIDVMMNSLTGRSKLLQLFSEKDGVVYITLPGKEPVPFKNGELVCPDTSSYGAHARACTGVRLLEEAVAFVCSGKKPEDISSIEDFSKMMKSIEGGEESRGFRILMGTAGEIPTIQSSELFESILLKYNDNPDVVLRTGINQGINISKNIYDEYNLISGHAYRIDGYSADTKTVYVVNPHDTKYRIEVPLEIYKTYFSNIKIFDMSD